MKAISLLPVAHNLPHHPKKKETNPTVVLVASMEDLVYSTFEELAKSSKDTIQQESLTPIHKEYKEYIVLFLQRTIDD